MKKITIGIPAYNSHHTIEKTLVSITSLIDVEHAQVIIIDDHSDALYDDIVDLFSRWIDIHLIRLNENLGPGVARNIIIEKCNTEFLTFIDADDVFIDNLFIHNGIQELSSNSSSSFYISNFFEELKDGTWLPQKALEWLHGKIYRTDLVKHLNIQFPKTKFMEDFEFNLSLFLSCNDRPFYANSYTYLYRYNSGSLVKSLNSEEAWKKGLETGVDIKIKVLSSVQSTEKKIQEYLCIDMLEYYTWQYWIQQHDPNSVSNIAFFYQQMHLYYKGIVHKYLDTLTEEMYISHQEEIGSYPIELLRQSLDIETFFNRIANLDTT